MTSRLRLLPTTLGLLLPVLLAACGTTSDMKSADGSTVSATRKFSKATVQNFTSSVTGKEAANAEAATAYFADRIAIQLRTVGGFTSISRNAKPDPNTLVIDGVITDYADGSAVLRALIGMGAGSSYFEATTRFKNGAGATLGQVVTDKNSWALGGTIAATQTPQSFMNGAAEKIATEARKLAR